MFFPGCEYICKDCGRVEFYHEDLRSHIRKEHCDPDDYLDRYGQFETKSVWWECQLCNKTVKRQYVAMYRHFFDDHHRMKLDTYRKKFNLDEEYEISVTVNMAAYRGSKVTSKNSEIYDTKGEKEESMSTKTECVDPKETTGNNVSELDKLIDDFSDEVMKHVL